MPVTRSAKKALRQSMRRAERNTVYKNTIRSLRRDLRKLAAARTAKEVHTKLSSFYKALDKAAKEHVISKNKASRLKSRASRALQKATNA